jgi:hypothetical protein
MINMEIVDAAERIGAASPGRSRVDEVAALELLR